MEVFVKWDDLIDKYVSGNKWCKLKYNVENVNVLKKSGIMILGGVFFNYLLVMVVVCDKVGMLFIGIVCGEELNVDSNFNLKRCVDLGMKLLFVMWEEYVEWNEFFW